MKRSTQELVMSLVFILVCLAFLIASFQYGTRARLVPVPVAILSIALVLTDFFFSRVLKRKISVNADEMFVKGKGSDASCSSDKAQRQEGRPEWVALVIVAAMLVLVALMGIIGGLFLFIFGYFLIVNRVGLPKSLAWGVGVTVAIWLVFGLALNVVFYQGVLEPLLG